MFLSAGRWLLAAGLAAHGIAHTAGFAVAWRLTASSEIPYHTTLLNGRLDVGDGGGRIATGLATQLAYAGVLGATYAVLRERARESRGGRILLEGVLTYAASLAFPDRPMTARRGRRMALRRKLAGPVNPADAFTRVTSMTLAALSR